MLYLSNNIGCIFFFFVNICTFLIALTSLDNYIILLQFLKIYKLSYAQVLQHYYVFFAACLLSSTHRFSVVYLYVPLQHLQNKQNKKKEALKKSDKKYRKTALYQVYFC